LTFYGIKRRKVVSAPGWKTVRELTVGIDIGGTNTEFGLVDRDGNCATTGVISTSEFDKPEAFADAVARGVSEYLGKLEADTRVVGVGIGAPNGNYYEGTIVHAPNLRWPGVVPLRELFSKRLSAPVYVTNDANAAAIGEMMYGAAKNQRDFIVVTLGTGVGSGFVSDGRLIYGHDGFAGELGHMIIEENGRSCGCGRKGCLETYASATGFVRTARDVLKSQADSTLRKIALDEITAEHVSDAAKRGDATALAIFDFTAKKLALGLANGVAITSPNLIVLFGGLARAGDLIFEPTRRYLDSYLLETYAGNVALAPSGMMDSNAAILGAAALAWRELESHRP